MFYNLINCLQILHESRTKISAYKKELARIDWRIVKRIVISLYHHSKMKKSHIATRCSLGYDKCRLYLEWMDAMDLIKKEFDEDGFEIISLTERGGSLYRKKFNDNEKSHVLESLY